MSSDYENSDNEYYDDEDDMMLEDEDGSASEMDVDAFDIDYRTSGKDKLKLYEVEYDPLSQRDVEKMMQQDVENISGIFGVDSNIAALLLRHLDWNKEKLIEKYMDNPTAVNTAAGPWSEHGTAWYSCNRYDEKASVDARDAQSKSRASLERYLHYYNRWANHEQSAKLSMELYAKTEKKMDEMQMTSELTWIEVQFMKKAVDEVFKCRMTLKWTYAMAYYLDSGNQKELFEDNQRDLERAVEELSELIESPLEPESIPSLRQKVTDKTVYVQKRNEIVLEDTAKGLLEGRWKWNCSIEGFD
ncbi:hypothetical protein EW026_g4229 [Hermanssonia centrifuga]|uniref:Uncharacterized protein n=1 Tax=Hermanssonia centrifuga TaxID=98765 RepID=A0A4S4KHS8_9APHY|nr:hypothetical protein EW026_g4229 [Hermanssonia centrifuga]